MKSMQVGYLLYNYDDRATVNVSNCFVWNNQKCVVLTAVQEVMYKLSTFIQHSLEKGTQLSMGLAEQGGKSIALHLIVTFYC